MKQDKFTQEYCRLKFPEKRQRTCARLWRLFNEWWLFRKTKVRLSRVMRNLEAADFDEEQPTGMTNDRLSDSIKPALYEDPEGV